MKSCTTVVVTGYLVGWFTSELFMYLLMFIIVSKHEQAAFHVMHMQGIHQIIYTIEMFSLVQ